MEFKAANQVRILLRVVIRRNHPNSYVNKVFVLGLFVDWRKVMSAGRETKIFGAEKGHWVLGDLFVTQIPTHNGSIQEWFFATFYCIVLPYVAAVRDFQPLIVVDSRASARSCSTEKRRGYTVVPVIGGPMKQGTSKKQNTSKYQLGIC